MNTRILTVILTGVWATFAAQAETVFSSNNLDLIYSGLNPGFTRDFDIRGYYTAPEQLQQAVAKKSTCGWLVVENGFNAGKATYTVEGNTEYFASTYARHIC